MTSGLKRYHQSGGAHFITFSCYRREPFLHSASAATEFEIVLERIRRWYGVRIYGYVVMPRARTSAGQRTGAQKVVDCDANAETTGLA